MVIYRILFGGIYIYDVYVDWNIPCISYSPKCYYGRVWDFYLVVYTLKILMSNNRWNLGNKFQHNTSIFLHY